MVSCTQYRVRRKGCDEVELETRRLILRELTLDDVPAFNEFDARPEVARWVWLPGPSLDDTRRNIEFIVDSAAASPRQIFVLAIVTTVDNRLIGRCGFDITGPESSEGVIGYALHPDFWGQGIMTEAVQALLGYGFGSMGLHRMSAGTDLRNVASWRVLEKAGLRREGHLVENELVNGEWCDSYIYAILAREWNESEASRVTNP